MSEGIVDDAKLVSLIEQAEKLIREAYNSGFARGFDAGVAMERAGKIPPSTVSDKLQESIDVLCLSTRPHYGLRLGFNVAPDGPSPLICQVLMYSPAKLIGEFPNFGQKSFNELYKKLVAHGLPMTPEWTAAYRPNYRA